MKTLFLASIIVLTLSGCVHEVPKTADHVTSHRYVIPMYHKKHVTKKEHTYRTNRKKKLHRQKIKPEQRPILHPNTRSFAMNQRVKTKNRKSVGRKVHPHYQYSKKRYDNGKNEKMEKRRYR